jgi:hypothetical protein
MTMTTTIIETIFIQRVFCIDGFHGRDRYAKQLQLFNDRAKALHSSLKWINVQATLLDICIAFYHAHLPPYVIVEIVDRFPFWETHVNRKKKIDYIVKIKRFCDDLIERRVIIKN